MKEKEKKKWKRKRRNGRGKEETEEEEKEEGSESGGMSPKKEKLFVTPNRRTQMGEILN